jgi:hypothetical protein
MEDLMSDVILAQCGLECGKCPARIAHLTNDDELRARTAVEWSKAYNADIPPEAISCSGCRVAGEPKISHCSVCEVRLCGVERAQANCGECADYQSCRKIATLHAMMPDAKKVLDVIHARRTEH